MNIKMMLAVVSVALVSISGVALADSHESDDISAVANAQVGLDEAISIAESAANGRVVDYELELEHGSLEYKVIVLREDGSRVRLRLDANEGNITRIEIRDSDRSGHSDDDDFEDDNSGSSRDDDDDMDDDNSSSSSDDDWDKWDDDNSGSSSDDDDLSDDDYEDDSDDDDSDDDDSDDDDSDDDDSDDDDSDDD